VTDEAQVIKIWDFQQLISGSDGYNASQQGGLCGGTIWDKARQVESKELDPKAQYSPRLIQIMHNNRNYVDALQAIRVSPDGVIGAVVLETNEILVYRFMDNKNELIPEKAARKPV